MATYSDDMFSEAKENFINGNYSVAEPLLQQLMLQNSRNPEIYQMLGTLYYDKGQFNKAIKTFRRALEIDPSYTDASIGLSIILNDLGRYEEGKKVFNEAQEILDKKSGKLDPYIEEKFATKHEELADLYFQYKYYPEAIEQLYKAQKFSSRKAELTLRITECMIQMSQTDKAIKELKNLIRDYPQYNSARMKLGILYYNMNRVAEATEQWENILYREPHHSEARKYLRMVRSISTTDLDL